MSEGDQMVPVSISALEQQAGKLPLDQPSISGSTPLNPATSDLPMEFWVYQYKVHRCPITEPHQWDSCPYAHSGEKARRRHPSKYEAVHCPYSKLKKPCPAGEECPCTHSLFEYWLHPDRFRTSICSRGSKCNRQTCFFAHSEADLRVVANAAPDPLAAENALNALAGNVGSPKSGDDIELPQLSPEALRQLIQLHKQQAAASAPMGFASAQLPMQQPMLANGIGQQQQRNLNPGLPMEQDVPCFPMWEAKRSSPPGSIQQQVQQMQLIRQHQQQVGRHHHQQQQQQGFPAHNPRQGGPTSPGARPLVWGTEDVTAMAWEGTRYHHQQQQQLVVAGGSSQHSGSLNATPTNSHVLTMMGQTGSSNNGMAYSLCGSSSLPMLVQEVPEVPQYPEVLVQQPIQYSMPVSGSTVEPGLPLVGLPGQQQQAGPQARPTAAGVQGTAAMQQLMGNIQVLTAGSVTGQLPEGGVHAIGEDLTKLLVPADRKALVTYLLNHLPGAS